MRSLIRIARAGLAAALLALVAGWGLERVRFGASDAAALARVQSELRDRLDDAADTLAAISTRVHVRVAAVDAAARDPNGARALFDEISAALQDQEPGRTGITLYTGDGVPLAWAGRVFDVPRERIGDAVSLFVLPGSLGPRLIRAQPVVDRANSARPATPPPTVIVEQSLATTETPSAASDAFVLTTSLVPVNVSATVGGPNDGDPFRFIVSSRNGGLAVEAKVAPDAVAAARSRARRRTVALAIALVAATLLLCVGPVLDMRRRATGHEIFGPTFLAWTLAVATLLITALALVLLAVRMTTGAASPYSPPVMLALALTAVSLVAMAMDLIERRRLARPRIRRAARDEGSALTVIRYVSTGLGTALVLSVYEIALQRFVANASLDALHFSLHPLSIPRIAVAFALVLLHAAAIWTAALMTRAASIVRPLAATPVRTAAWFAWSAGAIFGVAVSARVWSIPVPPLAVALVAAGVCGASLAVVGRSLRRASQAARLGALFAALLLPAVAMYPSLFAFAIGAKEALIAGTYGPQALSQREDLQRRVQQAVDQIESLPQEELLQLVDDRGEVPLNRAFLVWSRTDLGKYRMTSAVELYDADGRLLSRFALHLPEYGTTRGRSTSCTWEELFEEVSPFGSTARHVLRTSRGICDGRRYRGRVVLRAMLDYQTLPFVSTQSPYLESLLPDRRNLEADRGRDVEFAMYGWSRAPIIESRSAVWTLTNGVFSRLVESRQPFWDSLDRGGETFRVYFVSDRGEIYAVGYPVVTRLGHITNLAELALLTGVLYALLLLAWTLFGALTGRTPATAQGLLREIRSSFYRKLFLAYVAGAVVPVLILAFVIRTYFATQLRAGAVDAAQRTVTTAQRLVEDYAAIQQAASLASAFDDQSMVLVWRAIDEDVNLFQRARLQATSARDLFASSLLSERTPGDVYKSILLDRSPTFVGDEKIGDVPYRLAAAPVRAGGRDGIVTVPLTNRQNEIEQQIDELDRRVRSAAVLFVLLGAGIGYWMAERIADPVNRLTRATRRIAHGDLNARIAATSSDELRRLVEDFNRMAEDLQRQRAELERTQRLEAWAEMARQVAHDIKNPLTPIQLSAEHARRVNLDRGSPLSPVLDDCVNAILAQVRLLRQISSEFSSYATSPTARPERTNVSALVQEVVEAYQLGLAGRIRIEVAAPEHAVATIDKTLFSRAVTNIIENALHAMPGTGRLAISVREHGANHILVEIADTGVGMDPEALAKIFEPYFSTKATGTGLGLTIAKRNIELIGGTIEVQSQRGVGTTVTLRIPA